MSERQGEGDGFLDRVKEFFTGDEQAPRAEGTDAETDVDAEPESAVSGEPVAEGEWDGSGEVPELEVPESEAVQRHVAADETAATDEATATDETSATDEAPGYEGRHGSTADEVDGTAEAHETHGGTGAADEADDPIDEPGEAREPDLSGDSDAEPADDEAGDRPDNDLVEDEETRREREESFAAEHDPAEHDVDAGEEFRQRGDWAAGDEGPQVQEADGTIHDPGEEPDTGGNDTEEARSAGADSSSPQPDGPHESSPEEIRDGGHGWGSAAPIGPGVQPLGHPVKAWYDTSSYVLPGDAGYDGSEPDVWFVDAETAQRAGFRHGLGG